MRRFVTASLLAGVITAGLGAPAMAGNNQPSGAWVRLEPTTVAQGHTVSITARCKNSGHSVTASSSAFSKDAKLTRDRDGMYSGTATISSTARVGTHDVSVRCVQSGSLPDCPRGRITVIASSSGGSTATTTGGGSTTEGGSTTWVWSGSQWVPFPSGGVPAGGGSMAASLGSGPLTVAGLVMVLLGMLAGVLLWQRRPARGAA